MAHKALLVVRSVVSNEADRAAFDHWYSTDHMLKAIRLLGCDKGWRLWSKTNPAEHCAVYQYADVQAAQNRDPERRAVLIAEYDAAWPGIARTHEVLELVDSAEAE